MATRKKAAAHASPKKPPRAKAAGTVTPSPGGLEGAASASSALAMARQKLDATLPLLPLAPQGVNATLLQTASLVETIQLMQHPAVLGCLLGRFSDTLLLVDPEAESSLAAAMLASGLTAEWSEA